VRSGRKARAAGFDRRLPHVGNSLRSARSPDLSEFFNPVLLYGGCALGALGIALALPRRGVSPQVLGAIVAAIGLGAMFLGLGVATPDGARPRVMFYIFAVIALGASLRVISHPRPVYAALYFILTILASSGLYLLLSAEFMAFALIIVYAGAILITYLFVIMLATETPVESELEALAEYDRYSREPIAATVAGFILIAALSTLLARGVGELPPPRAGSPDVARIADLPGKVERILRDSETITGSQRIVRDAEGKPAIDLSEGTALVAAPGGEPHAVRLPGDLVLTNTEGVGFSLLVDHPGSIEIAGVILLMAMLGAVVLARKKVELDERARARQLAAQRAAAEGVSL
jgi:NADH-quinone oxidoreductase subunit J